MNSIRKYELMLKRAMNNQAFESFDDYETYDGFDDFEDFENYRRYAMAARRRGASRNFGMPKVRMNRPVMYRTGATPAASSLAAQFDIKITRESTFVPNELPVMLFMPLQALSTKYSDVIVPPAGITVSVRENADGSYTFDYNNNSLIDAINVKCLQVPLKTLYFAFLNAEMDVFKMRFTAPTSTYSQFFAQPLGTYRKSLLGKVSDVDTIPFISQKSPSDYAQHILDVDVNIHLQNDKGITYKIPQVQDSITISFFVNNLIIK